MDDARWKLRRAMQAPLPELVEQALLAASAEDANAPAQLPAQLPLVPLRNALLAAGALAPLAIARASSLVAIDAALAGDRLIAVFSQIEEATEAPTARDLHGVGTLAVVLKTLPHEGSLWLVVRALSWIRLTAIAQDAPYLLARVEPFAVDEERSAEVTQLEQALRTRVRAFARTLPDPDAVLAQTERMSALELADATIANLKVPVEVKAKYVSESSLLARLEQVIALADRSG